MMMMSLETTLSAHFNVNGMDENIGKLIKKIIDKQLNSPQCGELSSEIDYDKIIKDLKKLKKRLSTGMVIDDDK
jgi:hypothetical protein